MLPWMLVVPFHMACWQLHQSTTATTCNLQVYAALQGQLAMLRVVAVVSVGVMAGRTQHGLPLSCRQQEQLGSK